MKHIGVVGAGVVGLSCAVALLDAGHRVTLCDNDPDAQAPSWGNAGHIAVEQVAPLASLATVRSVPSRLFSAGGALGLPLAEVGTWLPFSMRLLAAATPRRFAAGTEAMRGLLARALPSWQDLVAGIGAPDLLREEGHYVAWHEDEAARKGGEAWARADIGTARIAPASAPELEALSALAARPLAGALRFSGTAQIADLDELRRNLREAFLLRGGQFHQGQAQLVKDAGRVRIAHVPTDFVLVCAGVRSAGLLTPLGHRVPMIAERGYHVRAYAKDGLAHLPPVAFEDRSTIVTRYGNVIQAASFVEFSRPDAPPDPRKWERLEKHCADLGLAIHGPFRRWMGARPTLPDYLPAIGRSSHVENLFYACGHQHLGLTLAPITAHIVAALVDDIAPPVAIEPFDLDRFG